MLNLASWPFLHHILIYKICRFIYVNVKYIDRKWPKGNVKHFNIVQFQNQLYCRSLLTEIYHISSSWVRNVLKKGRNLSHVDFKPSHCEAASQWLCLKLWHCMPFSLPRDWSPISIRIPGSCSVLITQVSAGNSITCRSLLHWMYSQFVAGQNAKLSSLYGVMLLMGVTVRGSDVVGILFSLWISCERGASSCRQRLQTGNPAGLSY